LKNMIDDFSSKERNNDLNIEYSDAEQQISYITMKIVAFLNARHYMVFADKKGKPHGHSWQLQAEARVPVKYNSFIKFEDLDKLLNKLLAPYQRSILNEVPPFDRIEPLTENISVYFFNSLSNALDNLGVDLVKLSVWENPTKGIEITERLPQYFSSQDNKSVPASVIEKTLNEAAPGLDNDNSLSTSPPPSNLEQDINEINGEILSGDEPISEELVTTDIIPEHNHPSEGTDRIDNEKQAESENAPHSSWPERVMERIKTYLSLGGSSVEEQVEHSSYPLWQIILAILVISGVAIWAYWPLITPGSPHLFQYGSDTWCHLLKAKFLSQQLQTGDYYPRFFSYWQNGIEPFRYWAPLPYIILALINLLVGSIFASTDYYIVGCAIIGGLSWLVFRNRIGLLPAVLGGVIWVFWIDNLNVAFTSGNYPRLMAIALLPLLLEFFSRTVENKDRRVKYFLITLVLIHMIILCHAMIAAVYCVALMVFAIIWWLAGGISFKGLINGGIALVAGILTSCWWLLPSLTSGGSGFSSESMSGNIIFVPFNISLNPVFRYSEFYWGICLLAVIPILLFGWRQLTGWAKCLLITGFLMFFLTIPPMEAIHAILPLHTLLWPVRFSSFWSITFIIGVFSLITSISSFTTVKHKRLVTIGIVIIAFLVMSLDSYGSLKLLISCRQPLEPLVANVESIRETPGWKVATLDLSKLGSSPSYLLTEVAGREQVFGWAWQGAKTAQNLMLINMALENEWYPYVFQRLSYMGTTDLMTFQDAVKDSRMFEKQANQAGFKQKMLRAALQHWHGIDYPYLAEYHKQGLAVGKHASIFAMQFPALEIGSSPRIDDYNLQQLQEYRTLVLSGASWKSQDAAEKLIVQYARTGGKVLVDLTGFRNDVMSRQPKFLDVYGEAIALTQRINFEYNNESGELQPFAQKDWRCIIPQGLDGIDIVFEHYGHNAALMGYKMVAPDTPVYFLGANLGYHGFLTHDPIVAWILQDVLEMSPDFQAPEFCYIRNYCSSTQGCTMTYNTERQLQSIIPVAALDGMKVKVDGKSVSTNICENLIIAILPAGEHQIELELQKAPVYYWGQWVSLVSIIAIVFVLIRYSIYLRNGIKKDEER
jgi:6-pyruvoyl tetrahydropterin synthase-like protein